MAAPDSPLPTAGDAAFEAGLAARSAGAAAAWPRHALRRTPR